MPSRYLIYLAVVLVMVLAILGVVTGKVVSQNAVEANRSSSQPISDKLSRSLESLGGKEILINWDNQSSSIPVSNFIISYRRSYTGQKGLRIDFEKLSLALEPLSSRAAKTPVNARITYAEKEKIFKELIPAQNGQKLNLEKTSAQIARDLAAGRLTSFLVTDEIKPEITVDSLKELGITTLLARGESDFNGSTASRIHNINVGLAKFQGLLVRPGEEFSFNDNLGTVEAKDGYQYELVIKNGKLIPEYGGGICQVSTTLFRAAANSGLPVTERRPHSFPVRYYNPQGFDATIYPGATDLKFKNDTGNNILIQNRIDGAKLTFEIYGSADGRKVELIGPQILEQNANGSLKTVLTRKVTMNDGTVKEDNFRSNYKSPAAFPLERNLLE